MKPHFCHAFIPAVLRLRSGILSRVRTSAPATRSQEARPAPRGPGNEGPRNRPVVFPFRTKRIRIEIDFLMTRT